MLSAVSSDRRQCFLFAVGRENLSAAAAARRKERDTDAEEAEERSSRKIRRI